MTRQVRSEVQGERPDNSAAGKPQIRLRGLGLSLRPARGRAPASTVCRGWRRPQTGSVPDVKEGKTHVDPVYKENTHNFMFTAPNVTKWLKTSPQNKRIAEIWKEGNRCEQRNGRRAGVFLLGAACFGV